MSYSLRRGNQPSTFQGSILPRSTWVRKLTAPPIRLSTISALTTTDTIAVAANMSRMARSRRWRAGSPVSPLRPAAPVVTEVMLHAPPRAEAGSDPDPAPRADRRSGRGHLGAGGLRAPGRGRLRLLRSVHVDVVGLADVGQALVGDVVVHERLEGWVRPELGLVHVDEQRARQGVGAVGDGGLVRRHALAVLASHLEQLDLVLVLVGEGEPDPAERGGVAADALDDHVVVRRGLVVLARGARLVLGDLLGLDPLLGDRGEGQLDEGVVGAGLLTRGGDRERRVGQLGLAAQLRGELLAVAPLLEALGLGPDQGVQVGLVEAGDGVVLRRGDAPDAVDADLELDELDALGLAGVGFFLLDGA